MHRASELRLEFAFIRVREEEERRAEFFREDSRKLRVFLRVPQFVYPISTRMNADAELRMGGLSY